MFELKIQWKIILIFAFFYDTISVTFIINTFFSGKRKKKTTKTIILYCTIDFNIRFHYFLKSLIFLVISIPYILYCFFLEQRHYKNGFVSVKLPPFFPCRFGERKRAAISKQKCFSQKRVSSHIALALESFFLCATLEWKRY